MKSFTTSTSLHPLWAATIDLNYWIAPKISVRVAVGNLYLSSQAYSKRKGTTGSLQSWGLNFVLESSLHVLAAAMQFQNFRASYKRNVSGMLSALDLLVYWWAASSQHQSYFYCKKGWRYNAIPGYIENIRLVPTGSGCTEGIWDKLFEVAGGRVLKELEDFIFQFRQM